MHTNKAHLLALTALLAALVGCSSGGGGGGFAVNGLTANVGTLDFGVVAVSGTYDLNVTLTNNTVNTINVTSIAITTDPNGVYSVPTATTPVGVAGGGNLVVLVRFTPGALQQVSTGVLTILNDGPVNQTITVNLTGDAQAIPQLGFNPVSPLDFGTVLFTQTSDQAIVLSNSGTGTLTITALTVSAGAANFAILNMPTLPLALIAGGANYTLNVRYTASSSAGTDSGTLTFTSDTGGTAGTNTDYQLSGTASPPVPLIDITPASPFDYGPLLISTTRDQVFAIDNTGTGSLTITAVSISSGGANFAIQGALALPATVPAGGPALNVTVRYTASATAMTDTGTLTIDSDTGGTAGTLTNHQLTGDAVTTPPLQINESFESGLPTGWTITGTTATTDWDFGDPVTYAGAYSPPPTTAPYGAQVAGVVVAGDYASGLLRMSRLTSPVLDFTGVSNPTLQFAHFFEFENAYDGARVNISTNGGTSFTQVPAGQITAGGYNGNSNTINPLGGGTAIPIWTAGPVPTTGWALVQVDLSYLTPVNQVVIQFEFGCDGSVVRSGWYIDGVVAGDPTAFPPTPTLDLSPASPHDFGTLPVGGSTSQTFTVTNTGAGTLTVDVIYITTGFGTYMTSNLPTFPATLTTSQNFTFDVDVSGVVLGLNPGTVIIESNTGGLSGQQTILTLNTTGSLSGTVIDTYNFTGGLQGWTTNDLTGGLSGAVAPFEAWVASNPLVLGDTTSRENFTPTSGPTPGVNFNTVADLDFVIADSDNAGGSSTIDTDIISPAIDCSLYTTSIELVMAVGYNWLSTGEIAEVFVRSTATGGAWVSVHLYPNEDRVAVDVFNITAQAAGQTDVQIRVRYAATGWDWWFAMDNVQIVGN